MCHLLSTYKCLTENACFSRIFRKVLHSVLLQFDCNYNSRTNPCGCLLINGWIPLKIVWLSIIVYKHSRRNEHQVCFHCAHNKITGILFVFYILNCFCQLRALLRKFAFIGRVQTPVYSMWV